MRQGYQLADARPRLRGSWTSGAHGTTRAPRETETRRVQILSTGRSHAVSSADVLGSGAAASASRSTRHTRRRPAVALCQAKNEPKAEAKSELKGCCESDAWSSD